MWKIFAVLILFATTALAQERDTAYEALRGVGQRYGRGAMNHVVSVTGVDGNPQPQTWRILLDDSRGGGMREIEVRNGQVASEQVRAVVGSRQGATIDTSKLNLDSSGAFAVASHTADKSATRFATASYTLRTNDRGHPMWVVTLHSSRGRPVGTIYIGANKGNVTRTEGMFAGAQMDDVIDETDENTHVDDGSIQGRIRGMFQRAQEEARGVFDRSKQSFIDFLNRI